MTVSSESIFRKELEARAKAIQLKVDCSFSGNINANLAIVSEAPGERETLMRTPMVGGAGNKLWTTLRKFDINRTDCYVTNIVKRQVSLSSKTNDRNPVPNTERDHWEGLFDWEMDHLPNLKYILCLGNYALHALIGETGITKWRGSVFECKVGRKRRTVKVICSYNPAMILRELSLEPIFKFDMNKLNMVLNGNYKRYDISTIINPSATDALDWVRKMHCDNKPISLDIETMANETACIGLANDPNEGMCINFRDAETNRYTVNEERSIRLAIQRLLHSDNIRIVAQNGTFDSYWLWYKDRIHIPRVWFDTLLGHHTLYPRLPHNLGFLTSQYTTHPYYKDEGKNWREGGDINQYWEYNVKDCCITLAVHEKIHQELKSQKLESFFFDHVMRLQPHLVRMTVSGVLVDRDLKKRLEDEMRIEIEGMKESFYRKVQAFTNKDESYRPNTNSPAQLRKMLFTDMGLKGRGTKTDKINRVRIKEHPATTPEAKEIIELIDKIKEEDKFFSTYVTSKVDPDDRIRCEYRQFGTQAAPGRLSSAQTMWGSGMNLQNQPHRAYPMFIADPGYMLSYFDLRQAEAKVVAYLWNVPGLIETFRRAETESGFDVHRGNASRIFRVPYADIPEKDFTDDYKPTRRYLGKRCVHGLNYRMQAPKLAEVCNIPVNQAFEAYSSYHKAFPEIQEGWKETIRRVKQDRLLYTPLGRRMIFMEQITEDSFDSVIAFVPQSTVGDMVASVIYKAEEHPDWPEDARMWMNIHDALIAMHRPEDKEVVQHIMKEAAEEPITIRGEQVRIFTDFKESQPDEQGVHRWSTLAEIQDDNSPLMSFG